MQAPAGAAGWESDTWRRSGRAQMRQRQLEQQASAARSADGAAASGGAPPGRRRSIWQMMGLAPDTPPDSEAPAAAPGSEAPKPARRRSVVEQVASFFTGGSKADGD